MKVFLSWSGMRSRKVAEALRTWLADTIHQLQPWMSAEDIAKGARWSVDLFKELESTNVGIVCLTPENVTAPWILFESGALGKALNRSRVCTLLYEVRPADLEGPLVQFQATQANEDDIRKLLHSLNDALPDDQKRTKDQVNRSFDTWWPELKKAFDNIPPNLPDSQDPRSDRDLLEELLNLVRTQTNQAPLTEQGSTGRMSFSEFFDGDDIQRFLATLYLGGGRADPNAVDWTNGSITTKVESIEGNWLSRWNGTRTAANQSWGTGTARVLQTGNYVVFWYDDDYSEHHPYAIIAKRQGKNRLIGRYINLTSLEDSNPWLGVVFSNRRIDGYWSDGRWDFRR